MTKLEQQIFDALLVYEGVENRSLVARICEGHAKVAARIAIQLAMEAYEEGSADYQANENLGWDEYTFKQFIQDYE